MIYIKKKTLRQRDRINHRTKRNQKNQRKTNFEMNEKEKKRQISSTTTKKNQQIINLIFFVISFAHRF